MINEDNVPTELTKEGLLSNDDESDIDFTVNSANDTTEEAINNDEIEDPLNECRLVNNETALINENISDEMIISPCEGRQTIALFDDDLCEELTHPYLFPTGKNVKL